MGDPDDEGNKFKSLGWECLAKQPVYAQLPAN
jgi:hypothetical protein